MCDLRDYNTCPDCGYVLRQVEGYDECFRCGYGEKINFVPSFITEAEPSSTLVARRSGKHYLKLEPEGWLCTETGDAYSDIELFKMEGEEYDPE